MVNDFEKALNSGANLAPIGEDSFKEFYMVDKYGTEFTGTVKYTEVAMNKNGDVVFYKDMGVDDELLTAMVRSGDFTYTEAAGAFAKVCGDCLKKLYSKYLGAVSERVKVALADEPNGCDYCGTVSNITSKSLYIPGVKVTK